MAPHHGDVDRPRQARQTLPEDRFDRLPKGRRVGAHRIAARPHRFWLYLVAVVAGVVVLSGLGIVALQVFGGNVGTFTSEQEAPVAAPEQVQGALDPNATVAILNGTETPNLQEGLEAVITENAWGQIAFVEYAASRDVQISAVFYGAPEDEAAAAGLARELGGVSYYESPDYEEYGVRLVVLLGADYAGPGFDQAAEITARLEGSAEPSDDLLE
ncbi:LytR C-terminal domain-containing protein [Leucobacter sp. W1478]|uniref:LytR C-terminal domain-containing protein n=1 Tax=Leucobacter sp. W1478 TaxID=3439065 RepID=UPI003F2DE503